MRFKIFAVFFAGVVLSSVAGCGQRMADVSGVVRLKENPLTTGSIQFLGSDGIPYATQIKSDGTYALKVPTGDAKVIISSIDEKLAKQMAEKIKSSKGDRGRGKVTDANASLIPEKYASWDQSGLSVKVTGGKNVHDFKLE